MAAAIEFRMVVKDEGALEQLRGAQRDLNRAVKAGLIAGAERSAVPSVRRTAPRRSGRMAGSIIAKATSRNAYLTSNLRGKERARVGLLNFGGTVRGHIRPRGRRRALKLANGVFRAVITTPRHYRAQNFYDRGVQAVSNQIADDLSREVEKALTGGVRTVLGP